MLKLIGLAAVILSSTFLGNLASQTLSGRVKSLEECKKMIFEISIQIKYAQVKIGDIFQAFYNKKQYESLTFIPEFLKLRESKELPEALSEAIKSSNCSLNTSDKEILLSFSKQLGKTDVESQLKCCEMHMNLIGNNLEAAADDSKRKGKLYRTLGFLGGVLIAILVI